MTESFEGKTACYDICPINHQCFGGYLNYNSLCDTELVRIRNLLREKFLGEDIILRAVNGNGLWFTRGNFQCVIQNESGVWSWVNSSGHN